MRTVKTLIRLGGCPGWSESSLGAHSFLYPAIQKMAGYYVIPSELWVCVRPSVHPSIHPSVVHPSVCQSALRFRALTLVPFDLFSSTLHRHWYRGWVVWDCQWSNFIQKQQSYGPWCMSKMLCASFPCSNFSTFLPIFFKLCIDIGIGEECYGIASGIISFRNNRVMTHDLCPNAFLVNILRMNRRISIKFCICIDIYIRSTFIQLHFAFPYFSTELRPLIYVQNVFLPNIFQINGYISRKFC